jgi:hypothetical protein
VKMNGRMRGPGPVPVEKLTSEMNVAGIRPAPAHKLSSEAGALLKVLSIFHGNGIQEKLLFEGARDVNIEAYPKTELDYIKARDELLRHALVEWSSEKNELSIHNLLQDSVRRKMDAVELETFYEIGISLISAVWPLTTFETRNKAWRWPIFEAYLPHVVRLRDLRCENKKYGSYVGSGTTKAAALFNDAAW